MERQPDRSAARVVAGASARAKCSLLLTALASQQAELNEAKASNVRYQERLAALEERIASLESLMLQAN